MSSRREELKGLAANLDREPRYEHLDLGLLRKTADMTAFERFKEGDLVRVSRSGGGWSLGVVAGPTPEGRMKIVVRSRSTGQISTKEMTAESIRNSNPLRIGDFMQLSGVPFWVSGIDGDGELLVLTQSGARVDPRELFARIEAELAKGDRDSDNTLTLRPGEVARLKAGPGSKTTAKGYVPIEQILRADAGHGLFAGNLETDTVFGLVSPIAGAALHTNKGVNYKTYNEDGAALFADRRGRLFLGVFDQAGGEGSDANARGAASAVAAEMMFEEMHKVAEAGGDDRMAEEGLIRAATRAHDAIRRRGKGEVTTYVGAMIERALALIVNVGDSGAQHYSPRGEHIASTEFQGFGRLLLEGLGMVRKETVNHATYRWKVGVGDYLVFGSDGLFDSKMTPQEIGALISNAGSAADATRKLRDVVSARMKARTGKPDNLTVLVVRVGEG